MPDNSQKQDDVQDVLWAASLLDMSEFDVFGEAYRCWFNENASDSVLQRHFGPYMFEGVTPHWVRHFTRAVLVAQRDQSPFDSPRRAPSSPLAEFWSLAWQLFSRPGTADHGSQRYRSFIA